MRCEDLIRELASPIGDFSPTEMAGHLAICPSCVDWSRRAARFDRIWEATRPAEPTDSTLDVLWASVSHTLDTKAIPATLRLRDASRRPRSTWFKVAFVMAQAAAILVAALTLFRRNPDIQPDQRPPVEAVLGKTVKPPTTLALTVDFDQWATVKIGNDDDHEVVYDTETQKPGSSAIPYGTQRDLFNALESLASR